MERIYLLEIFFSFDGVEYTYRFSRVYSSSKKMKESIECWEQKYKYTLSSKNDEELIYKTEIGSYYKICISETFVDGTFFL